MPSKRRSGIRIMGRLSVLVLPLLPVMLLAALSGVAGHLLAAFLTVIAAAGGLEILAFPVPSFLPSTLFGIAALLMLSALLRAFLHYVEQYCNHYIAFRLLALLRHKVFSALRRLAPAKLEGRERGELISLITSDIELLEVFYAHTLSPILIAAVSSVLMILFLGSFHPLLALLAFFAYLTLGVLLPMRSSARGRESGVLYQESFGAMNGFLLDSFRGMQETIQYGRTGERLSELRERSGRLAELKRRLKLLDGDANAEAGACISLFSFGMLFLGIWLSLRGRLSFSAVLLSATAMMSSFGPTSALLRLSGTLNQTLACGERVLSLLEEGPETEEIEGQEETVFSGAAFCGVSFSYGGEEVLKDLSLRIRERGILGIHGPSGSGKSTLLRLLLRFWDADRGEVQVSGKDIRRINTEDLRGMESLLTQESVLFQDTIAENIALGKIGAGKEEIREAARKASVHDFIEALPKGYDTPLSELGENLSGGERQRIGLARAFLHGAPLLLLDEPTANLDVLNEGAILKSLKEERENRTVVLVSHRASTLGIADEIHEL